MRRRITVMRTARGVAIAVCACCMLATAALEAHPGGLNAQGCHTNRKTGEYHCHRAPAQRSAAPERSATDGTYYRNCAEVRAAGKAPLRRGDPGYGAHLDRDGDGIACE
jgi:hypothetical protein